MCIDHIENLKKILDVNPVMRLGDEAKKYIEKNDKSGRRLMGGFNHVDNTVAVINPRRISTLAHEMRHAHQFKNREKYNYKFENDLEGAKEFDLKEYYQSEKEKDANLFAFCYCLKYGEKFQAVKVLFLNIILVRIFLITGLYRIEEFLMNNRNINKKNNPNKGSGDARRYIIILLVAFLVIISLPFILEYFIFRNEIYSTLSNGEWGGFLGSYLGGVISGIGTILAVWVTTKETRTIQNKTQDNIDNDRKLQRQSQRKVFTDDIAHIISEYIMDISGYYYASRHNKDDYSRNLSVKNYYLLKIKLNGVEKATELIEVLEDIHNHRSHGVVQRDEFNETIEKLMSELSQFTREYIKHED